MLFLLWKVGNPCKYIQYLNLKKQPYTTRECQSKSAKRKWNKFHKIYITIHESKNEETFSQGFFMKLNLHHLIHSAEPTRTVGSIRCFLAPGKAFLFGICLQIIDSGKLISCLPMEVVMWDAVLNVQFWIRNTVWKVSKYGVFSGPYFLAFGLNAKIYGVNLPIQSEDGKMRTRKNSVFGYFSISASRGLRFWSLNISDHFWRLMSNYKFLMLVFSTLSGGWKQYHTFTLVSHMMTVFIIYSS